MIDDHRAERAICLPAQADMADFVTPSALLL